MSEEADDMDAPVCDTEHTEQQVSVRLSKYSSRGRLPWLLSCLKSIKAAARAQNTDTEVSPIAFTAVFTDTGLALPHY